MNIFQANVLSQYQYKRILSQTKLLLVDIIIVIIITVIITNIIAIFGIITIRLLLLSLSLLSAGP